MEEVVFMLRRTGAKLVVEYDRDEQRLAIQTFARDGICRKSLISDTELMAAAAGAGSIVEWTIVDHLRSIAARAAGEGPCFRDPAK